MQEKAQLMIDINKFISELKDLMCCPISQDVIDDPVITPSGVTYDRVWIERHIRYSKFDPLTKIKLTKKHLKTN